MALSNRFARRSLKGLLLATSLVMSSPVLAQNDNSTNTVSIGSLSQKDLERERNIAVTEAVLKRTLFRDPYAAQNMTTLHQNPNANVLGSIRRQENERRERDRNRLQNPAEYYVQRDGKETSFSQTGRLGIQGEFGVGFSTPFTSAGVKASAGTDVSLTGRTFTSGSVNTVTTISSPEQVQQLIEREKEIAFANYMQQALQNPEVENKKIRDIAEAIQTPANRRTEEQKFLVQAVKDFNDQKTEQVPTKPTSAENIIKNASNPGDVDTVFRNNQRFNDLQERLAFNDQITKAIMRGDVKAAQRAMEHAGISQEEAKRRIVEYLNERPDEAAKRALEQIKKEDIAKRSREISKTVSDYREAGDAGYEIAVLLFGNDPEIQKAKKAYDTSVSLYNGVAEIMNNPMSWTGYGLAAAALNAFAGSGSSAEQQMFKQVLEEIRAIREQLKEMDRKLDISLKKLDQIIEAIENLENNDQRRFEETMAQLASDEAQEIERDKIYAQYTITESLNLDVGEALVFFRNNGDGAAHLRRCISSKNRNECARNIPASFNAESHFDKIKGAAGKVHTYITESTKNATFQYAKDFGAMSKDEINARLNRDEEKLRTFLNVRDNGGNILVHHVEQRTPIFDDIAGWLNVRAEEFGFIHDVPGNYVSKNPVFAAIETENLTIHHPHFVTRVGVPQFVELVTKLPSYKGIYSESPLVIGNGNEEIIGIRPTIDDIERASEEMRKAIPLAEAIYDQYIQNILDDLKNEIEVMSVSHQISSEKAEIIVESASSRETAYVFTDNLDHHSSIPSELGIFYAFQSRNEITRHVYSLKEDEVLQLAKDLGVILKERSLRPLRRRQKVESLCGTSNGTKINTAFYDDYGQYVILSDYSKGIIEEGKSQVNKSAKYMVDKEIVKTLYTYSKADNCKRHDGGKESSVFAPPEKDPASLNQIRDILIDHIVYAHNKVFDDLKASIKTSKIYTDTARAHFALDTYIKAGFGDAYEFDEGLHDYRKATRLMIEIAESITQMENAKDIAALIIAYQSIQLKMGELRALDLNPDNAIIYDPNIDIGVGDIDGAREALALIPALPN